MLAVGGYGRRELFPYSDVDILILIDRESPAAELKDALSEFVRLLWDSGLRLSHSVRTIAECTELHEQNIELNISLLDRRLLGGSSRALRQAGVEARAVFRTPVAEPGAASGPPGARPSPEISGHFLSSGAGHQRDARRFARSASGALAREASQIRTCRHPRFWPLPPASSIRCAASFTIAPDAIRIC